MIIAVFFELLILLNDTSFTVDLKIFGEEKFLDVNILKIYSELYFNMVYEKRGFLGVANQLEHSIRKLRK